MLRLRMLLCMVSLALALLVWPPSSRAQKPLSAHEKLCRDEVSTLYKLVELDDAMDAGANDRVQASVSHKAQDRIALGLPKLKDNCPAEAKSLRDLENGNYLRNLAARREKLKKADARLRALPTPEIPDSELFEGLEAQR